jgi:hypothetical protein
MWQEPERGEGVCSWERIKGVSEGNAMLEMRCQVRTTSLRINYETREITRNKYNKKFSSTAFRVILRFFVVKITTPLLVPPLSSFPPVQISSPTEDSRGTEGLEH